MNTFVGLLVLPLGQRCISHRLSVAALQPLQLRLRHLKQRRDTGRGRPVGVRMDLYSQELYVCVV